MIEYNFKHDIEDFINQIPVRENDFNIFKVKYCLSYQLKDKKQLIEVLTKMQSYFEDGVYKGPLDISTLLPNKSKTKNLTILPQKAPRHTQQYYKLLRLKQRFLGKDLNLQHIADYYHYNEIDLLNNLNGAFGKIKIHNKITVDHLEYISKELYYKLEEVKKDKETIISKTPKTKPNYFKIIYTR